MADEPTGTPSQDARPPAAPTCPPADSTRMTRRDFHRRAARVAAGLLLTSSAAAVADETAPEASKEPPVPPDTGTTPGAPPPVPEGLKEALARVRAAAPALPEDDLQELEAQVKSAMDLSRSLRESATPDGTEPGFVFRALLPPRKARS